MANTKLLNVQHALNHMNPISMRANLGDIIAELIVDANYNMINSAALAINATGNLTAITGAASIAHVGNVLLPIATSTSMSALPVTPLPTANTGLYVFYVDAAGVISTSALVYGATATIALSKIPATPANKTVIGFILVANATGANFVGGTTLLNAVSVTTSYYSVTGNINSLVTLQNRTLAKV